MSKLAFTPPRAPALLTAGPGRQLALLWPPPVQLAVDPSNPGCSEEEAAGDAPAARERSSQDRPSFSRNHSTTLPRFGPNSWIVVGVRDAKWGLRSSFCRARLRVFAASGRTCGPCAGLLITLGTELLHLFSSYVMIPSPTRYDNIPIPSPGVEHHPHVPATEHR